MSKLPQQLQPDDAQAMAADWRAKLAQAAAASVSYTMPQGKTRQMIGALAEFVAITIQAGQTLWLVVSDDEWLPELSNALDIALRPLCLVLPSPDFAAGITLRATLSLLKSRLSRGRDAAFSAVLERQRGLIEKHSELWQATLDWSARSNSDHAWPSQVGELFPVCILTRSHAEKLDGPPRDVLLLLHPERMSETLPQLMTRGLQHLLLQETASSATDKIIPVNEELQLKAEFEMLVQELGDMELEFATVQAELAEFSRAYHVRVGERMAELDALQARIARQHAEHITADPAAQHRAEQAQAQAERSRSERSRFSELDREHEQPFAPSADLKRLFRKLAQKIHPDRAENEIDRSWRTELMSEANRAYRCGDEMVLHEILDQWHAGQRTKIAKETTPSGLAKQVARMQRRLGEIEAELNRLFASRLYELFAAANLAQHRGRDLLQEMADQLDEQIAAAKLRLVQLEAA